MSNEFSLLEVVLTLDRNGKWDSDPLAPCLWVGKSTATQTSAGWSHPGPGSAPPANCSLSSDHRRGQGSSDHLPATRIAQPDRLVKDLVRESSHSMTHNNLCVCLCIISSFCLSDLLLPSEDPGANWECFIIKMYMRQDPYGSLTLFWLHHIYLEPL